MQYFVFAYLAALLKAIVLYAAPFVEVTGYKDLDCWCFTNSYLAHEVLRLRSRVPPLGRTYVETESLVKIGRKIEDIDAIASRGSYGFGLPRSFV
ncbi:hypothetical protein F5B22DRAFT_4308 [Xylaria bambusicola]|uniref:uncharacterized protein n=1 Tax=Xylaria bambusicola TaxID=326684 RepID=UPI002007B346|nr:uncharacterized protein F5B22DRAFT_4308 [Xylaria bambusicola]KAI0527787.1 hypothetical protein F5B22DRAFT_4308 [Xylaria bambusicola]